MLPYLLIALLFLVSLLGSAYYVFVSPRRWMKYHAGGNEGTARLVYEKASKA